jgi:hypothetical protein
MDMPPPATPMDFFSVAQFLIAVPDGEPGMLLVYRMHAGDVLTREEFREIFTATQRWYDAHTDEDIEAMRQEAADLRARAASLSLQQAGEKTRRAGVVYLMQSGDHYKIGCTTNLKQRRRDLYQSMPLGVTVLHSMTTDDIRALESYWHERFADRRLNGEWFALTAKDVAAFRCYRQEEG